ncbi:hypothetical protein BaRGS_00003838 [Batillaria attramentaria]|uniref:Uncharacterized protein n=1 Tax=Batillaria attramentaria TaxID=370345 RepID=A0ABD0LZY5_9CAEN|nr:hypothetical protein BaRGS_023915 [Batillaria attramentaria]
MDETSRSGELPNGLPGGRPQRALSPNYEAYDRRPRQRQRQRQGDASTDEIIRFVRGYQLEREPTLMRLQRKAVLPSIGQVTESLTTDGYTGRPRPHHDRQHSDSDDEDEDSLLDNEVAAIEANHRDKFRDLGVYDEFPFPPARVTRRNQKTAASYGPPVSHRHIVRPLDNHGHVGGRAGGRAHARHARLGKTLKQLPPIAQDELPERPSAPSPSLTPPGEGEELDSAGEPVDFIDAS